MFRKALVIPRQGLATSANCLGIFHITCRLFEGYWDVDSVLVDVDIPGGIEQLSLSRLGSIREKLDKHVSSPCALDLNESR